MLDTVVCIKNEWGYFSVKGGSSCEYKWDELLSKLNDSDLPNGNIAQLVRAMKRLGHSFKYRSQVQVLLFPQTSLVKGRVCILLLTFMDYLLGDKYEHQPLQV